MRAGMKGVVHQACSRKEILKPFLRGWMNGNLQGGLGRFTKNFVKTFHWTLLLVECHLLPTCCLFPVVFGNFIIN